MSGYVEAQIVGDFQVLIDKVGTEKKVIVDGAVEGLPINFRLRLKNDSKYSVKNLESTTICRCLTMELSDRNFDSGGVVTAKLRLNPKSTEMRQAIEVSGNVNGSDDRDLVFRLFVEGMIMRPIALSRTNIELKEGKLFLKDSVVKFVPIDGVEIEKVEFSSDTDAIQFFFDKKTNLLRFGASQDIGVKDHVLLSMNRHLCEITVHFTRDGLKGVYKTDLSFSDKAVSTISPSRIPLTLADMTWRGHFVLTDSQASSTNENQYEVLFRELNGLDSQKLPTVTSLSCVSVGGSKMLCKVSVDSTKDFKGNEYELTLTRKATKEFVASVNVVFR